MIVRSACWLIWICSCSAIAQEAILATPVEVVCAPSGDDRTLHALIERELDQARRTVEVAMFLFTSQRLCDRLIRLQHRGVQVRVLLDARNTRELPHSVHRELFRGGVAVRLVELPGDGATAAKFHHKFCVIDGQVLLTGSFNWTISADQVNHEHVLRLAHQPSAVALQRVFDTIWSSRQLAKPVR
jgi:phosphatidylserine/phosphatidylglycerophosphate/cardiolipin synthase-like enzyme